jgi:uncharacterized protein YaeQ
MNSSLFSAAERSDLKEKMLYQFKIELSDIDKNLYRTLNFRIAQHPSETAPYLLTRVLAYALSYQEGLEFSAKGLGNPDEPALMILGQHGTIDVWIEVGNPSTRKLHRASKASKQVIVYTYKPTEVYLREIHDEEVHRAPEIRIFFLDPQFLTRLEKLLVKNNRWSLLYQQGQLDIEAEGGAVSGEVKPLQ